MIYHKNNLNRNWLVTFGLFVFLPILGQAQCDIVATVFKTDICLEELMVDNKKLSNKDSQKNSMQRLAYKIQAISVIHLLNKDSYTPSEDEVDMYSHYIENAEINRNNNNKEIVATIEKLLSINQYKDIHKKKLEKSLELFRTSIAQSQKRVLDDLKRDEEMRKKFGEEAVKTLYQRLKSNRRKINQKWVASWKMNKALYDKYGGRIIFQQAGIEPIDAYRAQLNDIRELGKLTILKPEYSNVFKELEDYLEMGHNYLPDNPAQYFEKPYWENIDFNDNHRRAIAEYMAILHL